MQETQTPAGALHRELFIEGPETGRRQLAELLAKRSSTEQGIESRRLLQRMDNRLDELRGKGHTFVRRFEIGRNDPCPCESGKKFKRCHINDLPGLVKALEALNAKAAQAAGTTDG